MNPSPLVSIICLCHNQKPYVLEALNAVWSQTYPNIELIVVDDASTDGSKEVIRAAIGEKDIAFVDLEENVGNCKAFNIAFRLSKGDFIIDLAADDLLLPDRVTQGVTGFHKNPEAGIHFSDAFLIWEDGAVIRTHYHRDPEGQLAEPVPSGNVYSHLIERYFICPPTMMVRREVFEELGGYDESLHYEDFDFWIRSSRKWPYIFNKAPLVKKRLVPGSHSQTQKKLRNKHQLSTLKVCRKIYDLNRTTAEDRALMRRCSYEMRQALKTLNFSLAQKFLQLKKETQRRLSSSSSFLHSKT